MNGITTTPYINIGQIKEENIENANVLDWLKSLFNLVDISFTETDVFDELINNKSFLKEAKESREFFIKEPSAFTDLAAKYSHLIK